MRVFFVMFERATAFSAVVCLIFFGILGNEYLKFIEAKNQTNSTPVTSTQ